MNKAAVLEGDLPFSPLRWRVISLEISHRQETMATLYGNDQAIAVARASSEPIYPSGSVLSLVTWSQQDDRHWFGARIPYQTQSVEFVIVNSASDKQVTQLYQHFRGSPLKEVTSAPDVAQSRIDYILGQRPAIMP